MRPSTCFMLAALLAATVAVPALLWHPYDEAALLAPRLQHLAALLATLAGVCLPMLDAAFRNGQAARRPVIGSIARSWFLGLGAIVSLVLFVLTYHGVGYAVFWSVALAQVCVVTTLVVAGQQAALQGQEREADAAVQQRRKQSARDDILGVQARMQARGPMDSAAAKALALLLEEIRYLPDQASGPDAAALFARLAAWRAEVDAGLKAAAPDAPALAPALLTEANELARAIARWKR